MDGAAPRPKSAIDGLPQPEPGLTPETVIARAAALKPLLLAQQEENDERGYFSQEIHEAFDKAGLYRILQPKLFGGYEFDYPVFIKVIHELAQGHPSTAWCYTLASSHVFLLSSHWPEQAQREIFEACGGDMKRFVTRLEGLRGQRLEVEQDEPARILRPLVEEGCGG